MRELSDVLLITMDEAWSNRIDVAVVEKEVKWCRKDQLELRKSLCGDFESGVKVLAALCLPEEPSPASEIWRGFNLQKKAERNL